MRQILSHIFLLMLALHGLLHPQSASAFSAQLSKSDPGSAELQPRYIVVFWEHVDVDRDSRSLAASYGLQVGMLYRHALKGMAAYIPPGLMKRLEQSPRTNFAQRY
jgi:hypothetical protein